jgi:hypothetical protein
MPSGERANSIHKLSLVIIVLLYLILVFYASGKGPSVKQDDHWYMNDIRMFLIKGSMHTNQVFPVMIQKGWDAPPRVLHNLPLMYPVIPFAMLLGVYWGWIVTNVIFTLLALFLLYKLLEQFKVSKPWMLAFSALFLFWVTTIHASSHPLAEAGVLFFLVCLAVSYVKTTDKPVSYLLPGLLTAIVILNRPSFMGLLILLPMCIMLEKYPTYDKLRNCGVFLSTAIVISIAGYYLFPQVRLGLIAPLKMPDNQAMLHHFSFNPIRFSLPVFWDKLKSALLLQLAGRNLGQLPFVVMFNAMAVGLVLFKPVSNDIPQQKLYRITFVYLLIYIATLVWFQYQTRFMHTVLPFLLLWFTVRFSQQRLGKLPVFIVTCLCIINLAAGFLYAGQNRADAVQTKDIENSYSNIIDKYQVSGTILITGNCKIAPWVFSSNDTLIMCDERTMTKNELHWMRTRLPYQWVISKNTCSIIDSLQSLNPLFIIELAKPMDDFSLYRIQDGKKSTISSSDKASVIKT